MRQTSRTTDNVLSDTVRLVKRRNRQLSKPQKTASSSSSGESFTFLDEFVTLVSGSSAVSAWTAVDVSAYVPSGTQFVLLECQGRNITSPTGSRKLSVRKDSQSINLDLIYTRGTTTSDITAMIAERRVEISSGSFDYKTDAMSEYQLRLIGYWS